MFVCLHPNEPVHIEIMREICQNYIFVSNGRLIHTPDFDTLISDPRVREYIGHLSQNIS